MAKIKDLKFEIKGQQYLVHVNCDSKGVFKANLPAFVAQALDLQAQQSASSLIAIEKAITGAIHRFKEAETSQELFIAIKYLSSGRFSEDKKGDPLFNGYHSNYALSISWQSDSIDALAFHFEIVIKETVDTVTKWYETQLGKDFAHWDTEQQANPDKYYKATEIYDSKSEKYKYIPYSKKALESLQTAQEKIRQVSEVLFNFIEQDEKQIQLTLTKQKLLM